MTPHYSGPKSKALWRRVARLRKKDRAEMYALVVALQDLEGVVLRMMSKRSKR